MKILHAAYCFPPDAVGGTEVYVEHLAIELAQRGHTNVIAAPGTHDRSYTHAATVVHRYTVPTPKAPSDLHGTGSLGAARRFARILDQERPDVVHFHAISPGVSVLAARAAKDRGLPIILTYHSPAVSCTRGTLLRWGRVACDGRLDARRCAACTLHSKGLPGPLAAAVASTNHAVRLRLAAWPAGPVRTALELPDLVAMDHSALQEFLRLADRVVALTAWTDALLRLIGVPPDKIVLAPHGISLPPSRVDAPPASQHGPHRLALIGRANPTKGVDLVIRALRRLPSAPITLDIHLTEVGHDEERYAQYVRKLAAKDPRVRFLPPIPNASVVNVLRGYHALAVPSRTLETGPLVVLEAQAAGIPVIGSRLGGIADLVRHMEDGLLVDPTLAAWRNALALISQHPSMLDSLAGQARVPRSYGAVAAEMEALYIDVASTHEQTVHIGDTDA